MGWENAGWLIAIGRQRCGAIQRARQEPVERIFVKRKMSPGRKARILHPFVSFYVEYRISGAEAEGA
jgi:hypothetical protein